jgi:hypothetical protein
MDSKCLTGHSLLQRKRICRQKVGSFSSIFYLTKRLIASSTSSAQDVSNLLNIFMLQGFADGTKFKNPSSRPQDINPIKKTTEVEKR